MSMIGSGVAASAAAQSVAERQAVTKRNAESRESDKLRRELEDRFSLSNAHVEESAAAAAIEGDDESPADPKERERASDRQRHAEHISKPGPNGTGHIDIEA